MPIYEYRCQRCGDTSSFYLRTYGASPTSGCQHCGSSDLQRIMSAFAYHRSESDKLEQLDSKYYRMVDDAIAKAPKESDPDHHLDKMVPFSQAKATGEPYFKE